MTGRSLRVNQGEQQFPETFQSQYSMDYQIYMDKYYGRQAPLPDQRGSQLVLPGRQVKSGIYSKDGPLDYFETIQTSNSPENLLSVQSPLPGKPSESQNQVELVQLQQNLERRFELQSEPIPEAG